MGLKLVRIGRGKPCPYYIRVPLAQNAICLAHMYEED